MHHLSFGYPFTLMVVLILLPGLVFNYLNKKKNSMHRDASGSSTILTTDRYDVFLSSEGTDSREGFIDQLYNRLLQAGIHTFKDNYELRQGQDISLDLLATIKSSKILIPIFSVDYASSKWCLDELVQMMECKKNNMGQVVLPIFYKLNSAHVRNQTGSFGEAFYRLATRFNPIVEVKWKQALMEASSLKGWEVNRYEEKLVRSIVQTVLRMLKNEFKLVIPQDLVGIGSHVKKIMEFVYNKSSATLLVGIHGMGGIGKTTLSKIVYNNLSNQFEYHSFIPNIRESCKCNGLVYLQNQLIANTLKQKNQILNKDEVNKFISNNFKRKKVLIVLDDVDDYDQLKALAGDRTWFSLGSRIIITTRNKEILDNAKVDYNYELEEMDTDQSLILFCKHAFQRDSPPNEFEELTQEVVSTTGGLPLSLKSLGSLLHGREERYWRGAIKKLQQVPQLEVQEKLIISYEALDYGQQQIFLDIACFLIGTDGRIASYMWDACGFSSMRGIEVLRLASLIKVGDNHEFKMHDQLKNLGRKIVRDENLLPQYRSRLWEPREILKVLKEKKGTEKIEAIYLSKDNGDSSGQTVEEVGEIYTDEQFKNLTSLRFLHVDGAHFIGDFKNSFQDLKWLRWWNCPSTFEANNFYAKELIVLDLSRSKISNKWRGWNSIMMAEKLKFLDLTNCEYLESTFFLSAFKNLEVLILKSCWRLEQIDSSIGDLKSLVCLDISRCTSIKMLNLSICGNLKIFDAENCEKLYEIQGLDRLEFLEVINISGCTPIGRLDLSKSEGVKKLDVGSCENLVAIQGLSKLKFLEVLNISGCDSIERLDLPKSKGLKKLDAGNCKNLVKIHGLDQLQFLDELDISWCASIERLDIPKSNHLKMVDARNCKSLVEIHCLDRVTFLENLDISWSASIERLDLSKCEGLKKLHVTYCDNLVEIKGLNRLECLVELYVSGCTSIKKLDLPIFECLKIVDVENCENLVEMKGLDRLELFEVLNITGCISIERLDLSKSKGLKILNAGHCENLVEIQGLNRLEFLKVLNISRCVSIERLDLPKSKHLKILNASYCKRILEIQGIDKLELLEELNISGCASIKRLNLPNLQCLKILAVENCEKLSKIKSLDRLNFLERLNISRCTSIERLDLSQFEGLNILDAGNCENLVEIQGLDKLEFLKVLNIFGCTSIERLDLPKSKIMKLDAGNCENLVKIHGIDRLEFLEVLNISGCISIDMLDLPKSGFLKILGVKNCKKLVEIRGLENLEQPVELDISGCKSLIKIPVLYRTQPERKYEKKPFDSTMER